MPRLTNGILLVSVVILSIISCHAKEGISIKNNQLIYFDSITQKSVNKAIKLGNQYHIHKLVIDSPGGHPYPGMKLGRWIYKHKINVQVYNLCASACANYIFPAGHIKYIKKNDILGWHGGAYSHLSWQKQWSQKDIASIKKYFKKWQKAETNFYRYIHVNPNLPILGQDKQYFCQYWDEEGWYYSIDTLKRLGISNIVVSDGPWNPLNHYDLASCHLKIPAASSIWKTIQSGRIPEKDLLDSAQIDKKATISSTLYQILYK